MKILSFYTLKWPLLCCQMNKNPLASGGFASSTRPGPPAVRVSVAQALPRNLCSDLLVSNVGNYAAPGEKNSWIRPCSSSTYKQYEI